MPMTGSSISALLRKRAERQPDATAYTFIEYDVDPSGFAESLTWSQVYRRACALAEELALWGSPGDRAAIVAGQGLEYIIAFLGALQAGFIAVPLSAPNHGVHDERISSVFRDSTPTVVLTTSALVGDVTKYAGAQGGQAAPAVIEVDLLDLDSSYETKPVRCLHSRPAYLQYTSGSTRTPAGVMMSHRNVISNVTQSLFGYFGGPDKLPSETKFVSWLPFHHDMGLILGICAPIVAGRSAELLSPMSFLRRPARWVQLLAKNGECLSGAPNFAFELAVRRTSDEDMAGLDLGNVGGIISGSERIHVATVRRFNEHFARFNLSDKVVRPSYGLAEATVYVTAPEPGRSPKIVRFDLERLTAGEARPCGTKGTVGTELVSHGVPRESLVRIVDPQTRTENPPGAVGEIWVHGEHVAMGYWRRPEQTLRTFGGRLVAPSPGTPEGPWLRTGDLGVLSDGELFIMGRIKDLLIVDGRNHYPDDIEATIREITGGRVAAISVEDDSAEQLVAIIELGRRGVPEDAEHKLHLVKHKVTSAISRSHSLRVADLVLVSPGSIPITTSGKVRRSACLERYRSNGFHRLDASA